MSFANLLIHTCDIKRKVLSTSGYEKVASWNTIGSAIKCRHDSDNSPKINDQQNLRVNSDDDIFFFGPETDVKRGDKIEQDGESYDVIKVNKLYDSTALHHLEVRARLTDNN